MGRFAVQIALANRDDIGDLRRKKISADQVRRAVIAGVVDSGASRLVIPGSVVKQLGLPITSKAKVRYADGRKAVRQVVDDVYLELLGRHGTFTAIVEPKRRTALIGAIVLEDLDLLVDCENQRLIPRDPRFVVSEIE
jgi:predicted aspartyl protease